MRPTYNLSTQTSTAPTEIYPNLYRFEDTCVVYALRSGDEATLIDFGDGKIMDHLTTMGVRRVTDVLMTHHHRDQGQGLHKAAAAGARIWVPDMEQGLFADVDAQLAEKAIFNNYNVRQDRFSITRSVAIQGSLRDYAHIQGGSYKLEVLPSPGHTPGSISILADMDGRKVIFCGDLIAGPGKVWSMAATQWTYNGAEGAAASILSLTDLKKRNPNLLLPSHGIPMDNPEEAIDLLISRLADLLSARQQYPNLFSRMEHPYQRVSQHLLKNRTSIANSYVLLSESGKALLIDFGYDFATGLAAGSDRASRRPWLYTLPILKRDFGVKRIDVAIPTHYHDDHVAGMNLLREVEGTRIWAAENFADILSGETGIDLPCRWYDPVPVDRVIQLGKPVWWEEYKITLYPLPGHTRYAAAILFEVDGQRVLAVGDQYQDPKNQVWNYVYQNGFGVNDYRESATVYNDLQPDLILPGHAEPFTVTPEYLEKIRASADRLADFHESLLVDDSPDLIAGGWLARFNPFLIQAENDFYAGFWVEVCNPQPEDEFFRVKLNVPTGWDCVPTTQEIWLSPGETQSLYFRVCPHGQGLNSRQRIAADAWVGERHYGQIADAVVVVSAGGTGDR